MIRKEAENAFYYENKVLIDNLTDELEPISKAVKDSLEGDEEPDFLNDNKGKKIALGFINGVVKEGFLIDISSFGIIIANGDVNEFYYKHSIESYWMVE